MPNRDELIRRCEAAVAKLTNGQATRRRCKYCRGLGEKSTTPDANSPTGKVVHRPCHHCEGLGCYWQIRDTMPCFFLSTLLGASTA